ncbi:hypothetical protein [Kordia jejudonensis]|uniref:hypothetical protein n=1 Tax=Kordia jejudonensis TaxID=1348245 RepID=UPI0006296DA7|nr:hypothetical protein [Kordia jejudonensis]
MSENVQNNPEAPKPSTEIDLRELFRMIGAVFSKLFKFIRDIFLLVFDLIIKVLIIMRVHVLKFAIVGFLSVIVGWFIDSRQEPIYASGMYIEANYDSTRQLYSNIRYYNGLAEDADSTKLAEIFDITKDQAGTLLGFFIEPDVTENGMLNAYNDFMKKTDTTFVLGEIDFKKFRTNTSPLDFNTHQISVLSFDKEIIPVLQEPLVKKNIENNYIKRQKEINLRNLEQTEQTLKSQLVKIDTLGEVYKELLREQPKDDKTRAGSGTYIQLAANNDKKTKEIELLRINEEISNKILEINYKKELNSEIINVLSGFSPGAEIKSFYDSFLFRIPVITISLLLMFILLRELNTYLNTYEENKRLNA